MKVRRMKYITREYVRAHPRSLFLFGDNIGERGYGGQAKEMRDEPNSYGIWTKRMPSSAPYAYFSDVPTSYVHPNPVKEQWDEDFYIIKSELQKNVWDEVVIPKDGLGTGLAKMPEKCPKLFAYLQNKIKELEDEYR